MVRFQVFHTMKIFIDLRSRMGFCLHDLSAVLFFDMGNPKHKCCANRQHSEHGNPHAPVISTNPYNGNRQQHSDANGIGQPVAERVFHV